jgi:hypothetical protein
MDNPDTETTTVNVKGMPVSAWKLAREAAGRTDETLGEWLSRAIRQLAEAERAGPRVIPPDTPAAAQQPADLSDAAAGLAGLMQGMAALATASSVPPSKAAVRDVYAAARDLARVARGLPAVKPRANPRPKIGYTGIEAPPG